MSFRNKKKRQHKKNNQRNKTPISNPVMAPPIWALLPRSKPGWLEPKIAPNHYPFLSWSLRCYSLPRHQRPPLGWESRFFTPSRIGFTRPWKYLRPNLFKVSLQLVVFTLKWLVVSRHKMLRGFKLPELWARAKYHEYLPSGKPTWQWKMDL